MAQTLPERPLPDRNGVRASVVALPPGPWLTVSAFLIQRFPKVSARDWAARMTAGEVRAESGEAIDWHTRYRANLRVFYYRSLPDEAVVPFAEHIVYQDEYIVVADKPHFLPVTPGGRYLQESLLVRLRRRLDLPDLIPVHRLDRETAGLVLCCIRRETRNAYQRLFRERAVGKVYEAIAPYCAELAFPLTRATRIEQDVHFLRMREVAGEPNSETRIECIEQRGDWARYRLLPLTGRTHQLRVHCNALGMPIAHDRIYPQLLPHDTDDLARPLQLLAKRLAFTDPLTGNAHDFESRFRLDAWPEGAP